MAVSVAALRDTLLLGWWTAYPRFMPQRKIDVRDEELDGLKLRTYSTASGRYPVVVLHGLTHNGFDDGRLTPFCRDLAATGFITCSPDLEGLRELDLDETDIERIVRTVAIAHERHGRKVGIIGFSVGGTYGLIAAASPEIRAKVGYVASVGGYYALDTTFASVFAGTPEWSTILVMDWHCIELFGLTPAERASYRDLMHTCCGSTKHFSEDQRALIRRIMEHPAQAEVRLWWEERLPAKHALELKDNAYLNDIEARVLLLCSKDDPLIPASETVRIHEALQHSELHMQQNAGHTDYRHSGLPGLARLFYKVMRLRQVAP